MEHQAFVTISTFSIHHLTLFISWWSKIFQHAKYSLMTLMKHWPSNMLVTLVCCNMPAMTRISLPFSENNQLQSSERVLSCMSNNANPAWKAGSSRCKLPGKNHSCNKINKIPEFKKIPCQPKNKGLALKIKTYYNLGQKKDRQLFLQVFLEDTSIYSAEAETQT